MASSINKLMSATSLLPTNEVCEGYDFTRVCHSVHGEGAPGLGGMPGPGGVVPGPGGAWSRGVPGPRGCLLWGVPGPRGVFTQGGAWSQVGVPGPGGSGPRGVADVDPRTATAAAGTHPTGMHSCYQSWSNFTFTGTLRI